MNSPARLQHILLSLQPVLQIVAHFTLHVAGLLALSATRRMRHATFGMPLTTDARVVPVFYRASPWRINFRVHSFKFTPSCKRCNGAYA